VLADQTTRGFSLGVAALAEDLGVPGEITDWAGSPADLNRAARLGMELAIGQARAGRLEHACRLAEAAARIHRRLAAAEPGRHQSRLATALSAWGLWCTRLGRREQAGSLLTESVELHRALVVRAGRLRPMRRLRLRVGLAVALSNLGSAHSELGEHAEACASAEEAVTLLRELRERSPLYRLTARQDPLGHLHCLAAALNNLGVILADRGHRVRAWELAEEVTGLYRTLAEQAPVMFEAELARSLHNLGTTAAEVGRTEVALSATREAVTLHRSLLRTEPPGHRRHLGRALCSFARVRAALGTELPDALRAAEEAVGLHERLVEERPQAHSADLHVAYHTVRAVRDALEVTGPGGPPAPEGG
jgi:tetratricopeptide (TPR) repeat protein